MLRITVQEEEGLRTFQLAGSLTGPWVRELAECWRSRACPSKRERFDLTQVTQVDLAGRSFLSGRKANGAELVVSGCCMRALVAELEADVVHERDSSAEHLPNPGKAAPLKP